MLGTGTVVDIARGEDRVTVAWAVTLAEKLTLRRRVVCEVSASGAGCN